MALVFVDSFDHYATADITDKWTAVTNLPTIAATGRFSNGLNATGNNRFAQRTFPALATYVVGFAFKFTALPSSDAVFLSVLDAATTTHLDWRITPTGTIRATRNGTNINVGAIVLASGTWYYFETKFTIADAPSGVVITRINGVTDINETTADTRNAANATIDTIRFGVIGTSAAADPYIMDDFYVLNTTGSSPTNDFLGDSRVEALFPSGNGNSSQLDGSDGNSTDNYLLVDEATQDGDTTYVQSDTVTDKDTYAYGNMTSTTGTVYGVQPVPYARKTDAGTRSIVSVARLSATETDSSDKALSVDYLYYPDVREAKPGGGVWTISDVNSAEFGVKVSA